MGQVSFFKNKFLFLGPLHLFIGGPLLAKGELLGVTSFHKGIVPSLLFEVFARVSYYYKWIERRTGLKMPECNGPQAPSAFKKNIK